MRNAAAIVAIVLCAAASFAANPPICPYVIDRDPWIDSWCRGAPWIKVHNWYDIEPAKSIGAKVFYRPYDADSTYHDDGNLPSDRTGAQYADMVWDRISGLQKKPDAVGYRNEFNWNYPASSKRTCAQFVSYANRLRERGYGGKIIFGSFGVGWVDSAIWNDTDLRNAVTASDGVETHEYFDLHVTCCAPWLAFRHRDLAIAAHPYLQGKEWYIGEFGSDLTCGHCPDCDDAQCRGGWRDREKLTEQQYITEMSIYRAGCADQVVAVFVFQVGSEGWANYEVARTSVADYMKTTWNAPDGTISGTVSSSGNPLAGVSIATSPGGYTATTAADGTYSISAAIGSYDVTASVPGYGQRTLAGVVVNAHATTPADFVLTPVTPISQAKALPTGASALVSGVVTARFPVTGAQNRVYIEDASRTAGIGVATTAAVSIGDEIQAHGTMGSSLGERILSAVEITRVGSVASAPAKLGLNNRALGGGATGFQEPVLNDSTVSEFAKGLSNIGLLVRVWGRVTYVDPSGAYFYIDDGAGIDDGSGRTGARVASTSLQTPATGAYVRVTGISGATVLGGKVVRLLRPRSDADLSYAVGPNALTNPGFETGTISGWSAYGQFDGVQSGSWFASISAHGGSYFLGSAANGGTKSGGLHQRVWVQAGFSCQAKVWSRVYRADNPLDSVQNRIGVDPTGGTSPNGPNVQWSSTDTQPTAGYSEWRELVAPAVTSPGGYVTVFLDTVQINSAGWHISCFDDAGLYLTAP